MSNTEKNTKVELNPEDLEQVSGGRLLNDAEVLDMENCYLKFKAYGERESIDNFDIDSYLTMQDKYAKYMEKQHRNFKQYLFSDFLRDQGFGFWIDN